MGWLLLLRGTFRGQIPLGILLWVWRGTRWGYRKTWGGTFWWIMEGVFSVLLVLRVHVGVIAKRVMPGRGWRRGGWFARRHLWQAMAEELRRKLVCGVGLLNRSFGERRWSFVMYGCFNKMGCCQFSRDCESLLLQRWSRGRKWKKSRVLNEWVNSLCVLFWLMSQLVFFLSFFFLLTLFFGRESEIVVPFFSTLLCYLFYFIHL